MAFDYRTSTGLGETETPGGYKRNQMHTRTQGRGALTPQGTEPGPPVSVQVPAQARVDGGLPQVRGTGGISPGRCVLT